MEEEVKKNLRIFNSICYAAAAWNEIFSIPVFFLITTKLITVSFGLFALVQLLFIPFYWLAGIEKMFFLTFLTDSIMLGIVFLSVDMPVKQV